jgi:alpha-galactosidase
VLEVGNGGMTHDEYVSHFSLWCLVKSPLLIGCDVTKMSNDTLAILTNKDVIAISQDPLGVQGHKVAKTNDLEVWAGPLSGGDVAVILFNRSPATANITAKWADIGLAAGVKVSVKDLWSKEALGNIADSLELSVPTHGSRTLRLTPAKSSTIIIDRLRTRQ